MCTDSSTNTKTDKNKLKRQKKNFTSHVLHIRCHVTHDTCQMSHVTCHVSHVTCYLSPVTCHLSPATCHLSLTPQPDPQTLPLLTPPLSTVGRIKKTQNPEREKQKRSPVHQEVGFPQWHRHKHTDRQQTDIADSRLNRPKSQFSENVKKI